MKHDEAVELWFRKRIGALTADDGWLNITDLVPLPDGRASVGSSPECDARLSVGPEHLGFIDVDPTGRPFLEVDGQVLPFADVPDNPRRLRIGALILEVLEYGGPRSLRARDTRIPVRATFPGIRRFPFDRAWRIEAEWTRLDRAEELTVGLANGASAAVTVGYAATFDHAGERIRLLPTHWKGGKPMFVFRDGTSGAETYGAARFLIGDVEGDRVTLDFNCAFNPPCAFTDLAVCPLPPPQNVLRFPIRAGEMAL